MHGQIGMSHLGSFSDSCNSISEFPERYSPNLSSRQSRIAFGSALRGKIMRQSSVIRAMTVIASCQPLRGLTFSISCAVRPTVFVEGSATERAIRNNANMINTAPIHHRWVSLSSGLITHHLYLTGLQQTLIEHYLGHTPSPARSRHSKVQL